MLAVEDDEVAHYLDRLVVPDNFLSEQAQMICHYIQKFVRQYKCAPKTHFPDVLESEIKHIPEEKRQFLLEYVFNLFTLTPNKSFVLSNLQRFIKHQNIVRGIIESSKLIEKEMYIEAERRLMEAFRININSDKEELDYFENLDSRVNSNVLLCRTLVDALDRVRGGFRREELVVFLAATNVGKTWALVHCTKAGIFQGVNVLFYSLEMGTQEIATRIDMTLTGMGTKDAVISLPHTGEKYRIFNIYENDDHRKEVLRKIAGFAGHLIIKGFPYGGLTVGKIREDINILESTKHFIPDLIIIDYADLMRSERRYDQYRHELASIYKGLREIAMEYNCTIVTASQSNRASIGAHLVTLKHFAEDIQKANIADLVLSLCQTEEEEMQNVMRLFCCKNRHGIKGFQILNHYDYNIGQFSLSSTEYRDMEEINMEK